jgi:hypothetical protein
MNRGIRQEFDYFNVACCQEFVESRGGVGFQVPSRPHKAMVLRGLSPQYGIFGRVIGAGSSYLGAIARLKRGRFEGSSEKDPEIYP